MEMQSLSALNSIYSSSKSETSGEAACVANTDPVILYLIIAMSNSSIIEALECFASLGVSRFADARKGDLTLVNNSCEFLLRVE